MSVLLEVLSITLRYADEGRNGGAPSGTISAFDGKRGQSIYKRDQTVAPQQEEHPNPGAKQNEEKTVQLLLTGPYRAISADGCVAIEIDLHHDCKETSSDVALSGRKSCVVHIIDVYNDLTEYDVPVTEVVKTCIHCDESPNAEIKYALLSDAAEASVEVKLVRQPDDLSDGCRVQGKIIACTSVGEVVLFKSNNKKTIIGSPQEPMIIPLARSVLAVPLDSSLEIKVDLHIPSTEETVKYSVEWNPDNFDWEKPLLHFDCTNGQVDVKVTLSY